MTLSDLTGDEVAALRNALETALDLTPVVRTFASVEECESKNISSEDLEALCERRANAAKNLLARLQQEKETTP